MEPVDGPVTQEFGANPQFAWQLGYGHLGRDYGCNTGSVVRSLAPGTVLWADWGQNMPYGFAVENAFIPGSPNSGICVVIQHDGWRSIDAHLTSTHLNAGDRVSRGQEVGRSGNTGNSTGPHLHFETYVTGNPSTPPFGRYDPRPQIAQEDRDAGGSAPAPAAPKPAAANLRRVGQHGGKQRSKPRLDAPVVRTLEAGKDEVWFGWTFGQHIGDNNIWFSDNDGYVHSSVFDSQSRDGIPEKQLSWLADAEREVGQQDVLQRAYPYTDARVIRTIEGGTVERFNKWCRGTMVNGSDVWYGDNDGWAHSSGFEWYRFDGLTEVPAPPYPMNPPPAPTLPVKEQPADYAFLKAFDMVTEVRPAAPGNFERGNFPAPADVKYIFVHQFNAEEPTVDPVVNKVTVHLDSLINTFQGKGRVASAHFGVEGTRVVQFVDLKDRAYAQGAVGNGEGWSIETYGAQDPVTMATVAKLIRKLEEFAGRKTLRKHLEVMATKCGNGVDLNAYRALVTALEAPPVVVPPTTPTDTAAESLLRQFNKSITDYFSGRK